MISRSELWFRAVLTSDLHAQTQFILLHYLSELWSVISEEAFDVTCHKECNRSAAGSRL